MVVKLTGKELHDIIWSFCKYSHLSYNEKSVYLQEYYNNNANLDNILDHRTIRSFIINDSISIKQVEEKIREKLNEKQFPVDFIGYLK